MPGQRPHRPALAPPRRSREAADGRRARGRAGFTLFEVLVAIAIGALILAVITAAGRAVFRGWETSGPSGQEQAQVYTLVARCLASAAPFQPPRVRGVAFGGDGATVTLVSSQSLGGGAQVGLWWIALSLEEGPGGLALVARQEAAFGHGWAAAPGGEGLVLLEGLEKGAFRYQGRERLRGEVQWNGAWELGQEGRMPLAVALDMVLEGKEVTWEWPVPCGEG